MQVFLELLSPAKNDVVLDVGAGSGWIANRVADVCDEVYALEPNEARLEFIKAKHPQVKAFSSFAQSIPFPEKYFSKVYTIFAFHHFPDQEDSLEEFRRILKPGGMLLIHEYQNTTSGLGPRLEKRVMKSKVRFFDPPELEQMLSSHGYKPQAMRKGSVGYFVLAQSEA